MPRAWYDRKLGPSNELRTIRFVESLARNHTETALNVLAGIMNEPQSPARARVAAAIAILDRGWGKPKGTYDDDPRRDRQRLMKIVREIVHVNGLEGELVKDPADEEPMVLTWSDRNGGHA